jgi:hypothetical protein
MSNIPGYGNEGEILWRDEEGLVRDAWGRMLTGLGDRFYPDGYIWQAPPVSVPDASRDLLPELWEKCAVIWQGLILAFGSPVDFVRWIFIRAKTHRAIGHWVRHLEELVRRAILIDALTREPPRLKPRSPGQADARPKRNPLPASPGAMPRFRSASRHDPTTWKVCFRMTRPTRAAPARRRSRRGQAKFNPRALRRSKPYAYRIEALRRAIQYREAHVQRYAFRLARMAEGNRRANDPRELSIPSFDYRPERRTIGMHAVIPYLPRANAVAWREIALWNAKYAEPG